jgi:DNA-binding CsgD family transcriptional regulator
VVSVGLHGRGLERRKIIDVLHAARAGSATVLLIDGRAGTGKSRMLREAVAIAEQRRYTVLCNSSCNSTALPRSPSSVPAEPGAITRPPPAARTPGPSPEPQSWLVEQLNARLEEQAVVGPVLVALDDLQWTDPAWLSVLSTTHASSYPIVWVLTRRAEDGDGPLDMLYALPYESTTRIELEPLPHTAVVELVADLLSTRPSPALMALVADAGGYPLLITELIRGLREEGRLVTNPDGVQLRSTELPRRVEAIVRHQLSGLSARSRQLLQVASVLGQTFALPDAAQMLRETTATLLPALEEALTAGVLVSRADRVAFNHGLVWRVVLDSIPVSVRHALRYDIGLMLVARSDAGPPETTRGDQMRPAGRLDVVPWPAGPDPDDTTATELLEPADPATPAEVISAMDARLAAGHLASAARLARRALAGPLPELTAAELRCRLTHILIMAGQPADALASIAGVPADPGLPRHIHQHAAAGRVLALSMADPPRARVEAAEILSSSARHDGDPAAVTAAATLSTLLWEDGQLAVGLRLGRAAVDDITDTTPSTWSTHARLELARKYSNCQELDRAEELIRQAKKEIDECGLALHSAAPGVARARLLALAGHLSEAQLEASTALTLARELGANLLIPLVLSVLAMVALRTGDLLAAAEYVRQYRSELAAGSPVRWSTQYDWVEVLLVAEQDSPRQAAQLIRTRFADLPRQRALYVEEPGAAAWFVRLGRAAGDADLARAAVDTIARLAAANPDFPAIVTAAMHARSLWHRDGSGLGVAADEHREPWAAACAAEDLAECLLDAGCDAKTAVARLGTALQRFETIGACRDAARLRKQLRAHGVRRRPVAPPKQASSGWQSLNEIERSISHLVNQGLTNRQIAQRVYLSAHTVNYHLRQIFRKLDINSRVELARLTQAQVNPAGDPVPALDAESWRMDAG